MSIISLTLSHMPHKKQKLIAQHHGVSFDTLLKKWYLENLLSGEAISRRIMTEFGLSITSRAIHEKLRKLGISRSKRSARLVGIQTGRVDYSPLKKLTKSSEQRKGISLKIRYSIFQRDHFRCQICGADSTTSRLVIDHILPIVWGGANNEDNLRTLCFMCNHGKMIYENEK